MAFFYQCTNSKVPDCLPGHDCQMEKEKNLEVKTPPENNKVATAVHAQPQYSSKNKASTKLKVEK